MKNHRLLVLAAISILIGSSAIAMDSQAPYRFDLLLRDRPGKKYKVKVCDGGSVAEAKEALNNQYGLVPDNYHSLLRMRFIYAGKGLRHTDRIKSSIDGPLHLIVSERVRTTDEIPSDADQHRAYMAEFNHWTEKRIADCDARQETTPALPQ